jgi:hypothetical protein
VADKVLSPSSGSFTPSVQLSRGTLQFLEELMMEGDLLEVTLEETIYLWRLLNAAKNYNSELDIIRKKYNIPVRNFLFSVKFFFFDLKNNDLNITD